MANLFAAMKGALGHILDPCTLQALEVSAAMAAAGASQEDIEEMMAMIMSAGTGGISEDFLVAIKEAMLHGGTFLETIQNNCLGSCFFKWQIQCCSIAVILNLFCSMDP